MRKNKGNKTSKDFFSLFLTLFVLIFICIPIIVNSLLMNCDIATAAGLGNDDWLGFWGSYIGSALGVIATFLAFTLTYRQNAKQNRDIQEQNKTIQVQNDISRQLIEEQMRLQALPFINARRTVLTKEENEDKKLMFNNNGSSDWIYSKSPVGIICLTNIGVAPAIEVTISSVNIGHFSIYESKTFSITIPSDPGNIELKIDYKDRENRKYRQLLSLRKCYRSPGYEELLVEEITPPELFVSATRY